MTTDTTPALARLCEARGRLDSMTRAVGQHISLPLRVDQDADQVAAGLGVVVDADDFMIGGEEPDEFAWLVVLSTRLRPALLDLLDDAIKLARAGGVPSASILNLAQVILDTGRPGYQCGRGICAAGEGHPGSCSEASGFDDI